MQKKEIKALEKYITFISLISVLLFLLSMILVFTANEVLSPDSFLAFGVGIFSILLFYISLLQKRKFKDSNQLVSNDILHKYNLINEKADDLFFFISKSGKLLDVSDNVERLTGYSREEFVGGDFRDFIHEGDIVRCAGYISRVFTGAQKQKNVRYRVRLKLGGWAWYVANGIPVFDNEGGVESVFGIARDMTELVNAEAALTESEKLGKDIIENAPAGMAYINNDREIVACNSRFRMIFGITGAIAPKRKITSFAGVNKMEDILNRVYDGEFLKGEILSLSGKSTLKMDAAPHFDRNGDVSGIVALFEDTGEVKTLDRFLAKSRKLEALGALAGGITHDFNNILTAILGFTDLLISGKNKEDQDRELLEEVFRAGKRAESLVKQLLQFTRQPDESPKPMELQHLIKEIIKLLKSTFPAKIKIKSTIDTHAGFVEASLSQFHQMVISAAMCAYYYLKNRTGIVHIKYKGRHDDENRDLVQLSILMSPLGTIKDEDELGQFISINRNALELIKSTAKNFNGFAEVIQIEKESIAININLPLIKEEAEETSGETKGYKTGAGHILFVDDEAPIRRVIKEAMAIYGYAITTFGNPAEALSAFKNNPKQFDYLITDQNMPEMHGIDLAREVIKIKDKIPVIICTGYDESLTDDVIKNAGVKKLIIKPVLAVQLHETIQQIIGKGN